MVNVVCLKWGTKFGPEYVNRLFYAVRRNTSIPFAFHCFTDNSEGLHKDIETHPLPHKLPGEGWWQKLYLFSNDIDIEGRIVFMDLDTLITGNIDDILSHNKGFVVLHDFFLIRMPNRKDRWGLGKEAVQSSIMSWEARKHTHIWTEFVKDAENIVRSYHPHGDQRWIQFQQKERLYWQDLFPNHIVSYKVHCGEKLASNARIVCYHGKPSIPESINTTTKVQGYTLKPAAWVKEYWKDEI